MWTKRNSAYGKALIIALVLSLCWITILPLGEVSAAPGWYNAYWRYRRAIILSNSGAALSNYQMKIELNAGNFDFSKARTSGQDLRFTKSDEVTLMSHFIESYSQAGQTATVWVKVPSLAASNDTTIYVYYGNSTAASTSSVDNVFQLYDNFALTGQPDNLDKVSRVGTALTPGLSTAWDALIRERMSVLYDTDDSTYKAWYSGHEWHNDPGPDEATSDIGYAYSADGITWSKHGDAVMDSGWQDQDPSVVKVGNTFYMYVETTDRPAWPSLDTYRYTSLDGINWSAGAMVKDQAGTPLVWVEGVNSWHMLYEDMVTRGGANVFPINHATSADGITWIDDASNPVVPAEDGIDSCPDGIYKDASNYYHLYYHGGDLPRNVYARSTFPNNLTAWTTMAKPFYPRQYESFVPLKVGNEMWFYAWNTGAYLHLENEYDGILPNPPYGYGYTDGRDLSGYSRFKGYDAGNSLNTSKWDKKIRSGDGSSAAWNFNPDGIEISPGEEESVQSASLLSKATFTGDIIIEIRKKLIGNSYADVSLGTCANDATDIIDEAGGYTEWHHTALKKGYTWMYNQVNNPSSCIRRANDVGVTATNISGDFDPGEATQGVFNDHELTLRSNGYVEWKIDGAVVASATDATYATTAKKLMITQGQYKPNTTTGNYRGGQTVVDSVRVRKYAVAVPTYAVNAEEETTAPPSGSISINSGAASTTSAAVQLTLSASDPFDSASLIQMQISNSSAFVGALWEPYVTSRSWTLEGGYGARTVYARFKNSRGYVSGAKEDAIAYQASTNPWDSYTGPNGEMHISPTWYLAEGSTDWGFSDYISVVNPNSTPVTCKVTYMTTAGPIVKNPNPTIPANAQLTINPADDLGPKDFSTLVECLENKPIAVDRTMTWIGAGQTVEEGHNSMGVTKPSKEWGMAEGSSKWGFETWLLIQNPNATTDATVTVTYMIEGEGPKTVNHNVPKASRASFNMKDDIGEKDASIKVESNVPVIPERAMYRNNRREGHDSVGTTTPATNYYLAEGCAGYGFTTYILIQNPNSTPTNVDVTYMTGAGPVPVPTFSMPASSRKTINVNSTATLPNPDFSTRVHGSQPIIAERAMYWDNGTGESCHDSIGLAAPHRAFYLPDGQSSAGRDTWTLVQNPNDTPTEVEIRYLTPTGAGNVVFYEYIPASSRMSFEMKRDLPNSRAAIVVVSQTTGNNIMVERSMYWGGADQRGGGTDTVGGFMDATMNGVL